MRSIPSTDFASVFHMSVCRRSSVVRRPGETRVCLYVNVGTSKAGAVSRGAAASAIADLIIVVYLLVTCGMITRR